MKPALTITLYLEGDEGLEGWILQRAPRPGEVLGQGGVDLDMAEQLLSRLTTWQPGFGGHVNRARVSIRRTTVDVSPFIGKDERDRT